MNLQATRRQFVRRQAEVGLFVVCQVMLVLLVGAVIVEATTSGSHTQLTLPVLQKEPLQIAPSYNDSRIVTDEQLLNVLQKLEPALGHERPKINYVDHALRFWQLDAQFSNDRCLSGQKMRQLLIDDHAFVGAWGENTPPLLMPTSEGVAVRVQQGFSTSSHVDHTLASLAEVGTPLDYPVATRVSDTTVDALVRQTLSDFSINQLEYEWTALLLAHYAPTKEAWISKEGQRITFDLLAQRIMRQRYSQGVCRGTHRLYTLTVLLKVDDSHDILSDATRQEVIEHLTEATRRLVTTQSIQGYWGPDWASDSAKEKDPSPQDLLRARILATGHALEWWALAPEEVHPPREVMIRAAQWLVREIEAMPSETVLSNYTFLTHAGRALALWRGDFPYPLMQRIQMKLETGV